MADGNGVDPVNATWVTAAIGAAAAVFGACLVWLGQRVIGKAAFQTALNDGFAKITAELRKELADSKRERLWLHRMLNDERIQTKAERTVLQSEINGLTQTIESLKALLRRHGIDVPHTRPPFTVEDPPPMAILLQPVVGEQLENWDIDD